MRTRGAGERTRWSAGRVWASVSLLVILVGAYPLGVWMGQLSLGDGASLASKPAAVWVEAVFSSERDEPPVAVAGVSQEGKIILDGVAVYREDWDALFRMLKRAGSDPEFERLLDQASGKRLWEELQELDPADRETFLAAALQPGQSLEALQTAGFLLARWAETDLEWALGKFDEMPGEAQAAVGLELIKPLLKHDPKMAWDWIEGMRHRDTASFFGRDLELQMQASFVRELEVRQKRPLEAMEFALKMTDERRRRSSLEGIAAKLVKDDPAGALAQLPGDPEIDEAILNEALEYWVRQEPTEAVDWLAENEDLVSEKVVTQTLWRFSRDSSQEERSSFYGKLGEPALQLVAAREFAKELAMKRTEEAASWVSRIESLDDRATVARETLARIGVFEDNLDQHLEFIDTVAGEATDLKRHLLELSLREFRGVAEDTVFEYIETLRSEDFEMAEALEKRLER